MTVGFTHKSVNNFPLEAPIKRFKKWQLLFAEFMGKFEAGLVVVKFFKILLKPNFTVGPNNEDVVNIMTPY